MHLRPESTSGSDWQYSPMIQSAQAQTRAERIWEKVSRRRVTIDSRSFGLVSMISRTKKTTSRAEAVLLSPKKSISTCTTLLATSGNLMAQL